MSTQFATTHGATAPLDPQHPPAEVTRERQQRRRDYPPLVEYLVKTCDSIASLDKSDRVRIQSAQAKAVAFYDGRQDGEVRDGVWHDNPYIGGEIRPEDNLYAIQVNKLNMEMTRTEMEYEVEAVDVGDADKQEAAKFLKHRLSIHRERTETEAFKQAENYSLLLKTWTHRYVFFNPKEKGEGVERLPRMGQRDGQAMQATVCRTCGMPSVDKTTPCESCGDTEQKTVAVSTTGGMDISYEDVPGGQVVTVRPDAMAIQLDMSARGIESSGFLRWTLTLRRYEWEAMFPDRHIPPSGRSDQARWADDLQSAPSNETWPDSLGYEESAASATSNQFEKIEGELVWLDPVVYADYTNKQDERTPSGTLPAGESLLTRYPDGLCIARIGKTILDLYPSNKNKCWSMCVYGYREHALHGSGTFALLGPCETLNDLKAFIHVNCYYNAAPREFIRKGALERDQLPAISQVGLVNMQFEEGQRIVGHAYDKAPASSLAPDVYAYQNDQAGSLQEHAGTSSLSLQGAADLKAFGTATGVEAARDQAVGRMIPNLKLRTDMQCEWGYQVAELERENCSAEMFAKGADIANEKGDIKFTARGVRAFFDSDVRADFRIRAVPGSWVPTTPAQEKANKTDFAMIAGQLGGLPQGSELLAEIGPTYGVDFEVNEYGAVRRAGQLRLREWARIAGVISENGLPPSPEIATVVLEMSPEWARINPLMDAHEAYREYLSDWFTSDEGLQADPLLRAVVQLAHMEHGKGLVAQAQLTAVGEIMANQPAQDAAAEQAGAQAEQQMAVQGQQQAQELEGEEARLQIEGQREGMNLAAAEQGAMVKAGDREHQLAIRQATEALRQ